jgi:hypothetical protein
MYGVVVLMALSTNTDTADFGRRNGCNGCNGCNGYNCNGCRGGGLFGRRNGCNGCNGCNGGGCHGRVYNGGCNGGGCNGGHVHHACNGGHVHNGCNGGHVHNGCTGGHMMHTTSDANSATVVVTLASAQQLQIDQYTVPTASDRHLYVTTPLAAGESRSITFTAGGKTQTVKVTAGQRLEVRLGEQPATGGVAAR